MFQADEGSVSRRLGVLISGRGSNLQSLIDAIEEKRLDASIAVVISNKADAGGLEAHMPRIRLRWLRSSVTKRGNVAWIESCSGSPARVGPRSPAAPG